MSKLIEQAKELKYSDIMVELRKGFGRKIDELTLNGYKAKSLAKSIDAILDLVLKSSQNVSVELDNDTVDPDTCKHPNRTMNGGCPRCGDPCY
jgi:hypothetical protein